MIFYGCVEVLHMNVPFFFFDRFLKSLYKI